MDDQGTNREGGGSVSVRQFTLKRLLASTTMVAIGMGVLSIALREVRQADADTDMLTLAALYVGGGTLAVAGLFCLIKRTAVGALVGFVLYAAWVAFLAMQI